MSNAMEEGVLLQMDNPSHTDTGKIAALGGGAVGMALYIALSVWAPELGAMASGILAVAALSITAYVIHRRIKARHIAKEAARMSAERAAQAHETDALIAKMKKMESQQ